MYSTVVAKAQNLPYARLTGDGPWYRYLLDLFIVSPIVVCLALGGLFALAPKRKEIAFVAVFVACNIRYGMNLRYASVWELPLRIAAFAMLWQVCSCFGRRQWIAVTAAVALLCGYEFRQYLIIATNPKLPLYETVPAELLQLVHVIKTS